eukprot:jgi/Chrzof1/12924/Cz07g12150.t1
MGGGAQNSSSSNNYAANNYSANSNRGGAAGPAPEPARYVSYSGIAHMQPPGGRSTMNLGWGPGSSPAAVAPVAVAPGGYRPVHGAAAPDLSSQLQLPTGAARRPVSAGRRAGQQESGAAAVAGGSYGQAAYQSLSSPQSSRGSHNPQQTSSSSYSPRASDGYYPGYNYAVGPSGEGYGAGGNGGSASRGAGGGEESQYAGNPAYSRSSNTVYTAAGGNGSSPYANAAYQAYGSRPHGSNAQMNAGGNARPSASILCQDMPRVGSSVYGGNNQSGPTGYSMGSNASSLSQGPLAGSYSQAPSSAAYGDWQAQSQQPGAWYSAQAGIAQNSPSNSYNQDYSGQSARQPAYPGQRSPGGMGGGGVFGAMGVPTPAYAGPMGGAAFTPVKGRFCGKIVMQPPGGRTTLNIFG